MVDKKTVAIAILPRTLWLVSLALISILVLSSLQIYAWEGEGEGDVTVTVQKPNPPSIISPGSRTGALEIDDLTPLLQWNAVSDADYYALAISKYPYGSGNFVYNPQHLTGTSHVVPSGILESGKKYRWNMQAHNSAGWSDISNTLYFQTAVADVTLTLYVHKGSASGSVLSGVRVTGQDGGGSSFVKTTSTSGYVTITGTPGTWSFTASKTGYEAESWSQSITGTSTKHAFLAKIPTSLPTIGSFSVTISQGESGTTSFRVSNPNSFSVKVTGFLVTDYSGFNGEITATNLPLDIAAGGTANVQLSVVDNGSSPGKYTIRFNLSGTP